MEQCKNEIQSSQNESLLWQGIARITLIAACLVCSMSVTVYAQQPGGYIVSNLQTALAGIPQIHPNFYSPSIVFENGIYKMWTTSADRVVYFESSDGVTWGRGIPVLEATAGTWEEDLGQCFPSCNDPNHFATGISDPRVVINATPGWRYTMYYTAGPAPNSATRGGLGVALSHDGIQWAKWHGNPIRSFPGGNTFVMQALSIGNTRYVYFLGGGDQSRNVPPVLRVMKDRGDGIHFENDEFPSLPYNAYPLFYDAADGKCWLGQSVASNTPSGPSSFNLYQGSDCMRTSGTVIASVGPGNTGNATNFGPQVVQRDASGQRLHGAQKLQFYFASGNSWGGWQPRSVELTPVTGQLSFSPSSRCQLAQGATTCPVTIRWSTANAILSVLQAANESLWPNGVNLQEQTNMSAGEVRLHLPVGNYLFAVSGLTSLGWSAMNSVTYEVLPAPPPPVPTPPPVLESVMGYVDSITFSQGQYTVVGWACQLQSETSISVRLFANASPGQTNSVLISETKANLTGEAAIGKLCRTNSSNRRFSIQIPSSKLAPYQKKPIFIQGISISGKLQTLLFRSGEHLVPEIPVAPAPPASQVRGFVDGVQFIDNNYFLKGWACQSGNAKSIDIHVYVGGPAGTGQMIGSRTAQLASEPAVGSVCGSGGKNHRFSFVLSEATLKKYKGKAIYVHGISLNGGANLTITQSGKFKIP